MNQLKNLLLIVFGFVCSLSAQTLSRPGISSGSAIDTSALATKSDVAGLSTIQLPLDVLVALTDWNRIPICRVEDLPTRFEDTTTFPVRWVVDMLNFGSSNATGGLAYWNRATSQWLQFNSLVVTTDYLTLYRSVAQNQAGFRSNDYAFAGSLNTGSFNSISSSNANSGSAYTVEAESAFTLHVNSNVAGSAVLGASTGVFPMAPLAFTHWYTRIVFRHSGLSDSGTVRTYWSQIGPGAGLTFPTNGTTAANGVFFLTDAQNASTYLGSAPGTVFVCVTRTGSGAAQTSTVTSVTPSVSSAAYDIGELVGSPGQIQFYLNGTLVATHKSNLPTAALRHGASIIGTAGTNDRSLYIKSYQVIALP